MPAEGLREGMRNLGYDFRNSIGTKADIPVTLSNVHF
jgi:hypothetical protein